jgi:hypothetical protein
MIITGRLTSNDFQQRQYLALGYCRWSLRDWIEFGSAWKYFVLTPVLSFQEGKALET